MAKLNQDGTFLEKPSNIWITLVGVIISFAVALAVLQQGREVNASNILDLKANFESIDDKLDLLNDKLNQNAIGQAEIKTDIVYIKEAIKSLK